MKSCLLVASVLLALSANARTVSPNGNTSVELSDKCLEISCKWGDTWLPVMKMSVDKPLACTEGEATEVSYIMPLGKKRHCENAYTTASYAFADGDTLTVRIYNDGVAWSGLHDYDVDFSPAKDKWLVGWSEAYEGIYSHNGAVVKDGRYAYPALFGYEGDRYALLSESCITADNAATSMYATGDSAFALRPDGEEDGGWQTLIVGSLADVVESTLITDNSEPVRTDLYDNPLADRSGVASWIYWAYNHGSNDYAIIKKYVDMGVELHLPYVLIDAEWDDMDKIASNEGKTIEDAVKYAVDNGIKPIIWYNSSVGWIDGAPGPKFRLNNPENREKEFAWCESIGVDGVKIDFFSGDTNLNMRYMIELLESAARHNLTVNFHGATLPRGWQRTYPNLMSTEGVYGSEWYNNVPTFTAAAASHNAMLPFTRNVVGSMDYTPCAFSDSQHPHITTHAHELALTALFESGIQHIADRPESLLAQPEAVRDYLSQLPASWDESLLLSGRPGEHVVMARRKGSEWYITGINGTDSERMISFDLGRVKNAGKQITVFEDSGDASSPWKITQPTDIPTSVNCRPRGGFVMVIR